MIWMLIVIAVELALLFSAAVHWRRRDEALAKTYATLGALGAAVSAHAPAPPAIPAAALAARIDAALAEQLAYEDEHAERQGARLAHIAHDRHGAYDIDQRVRSVEIKVRRALEIAGEQPPEGLRAIIINRLRGEA
jgi:hypothetical protein